MRSDHPSTPTSWAIVGRPNVGKSTLFNRLMGRRTAVVAPTRGTTRDRIEGRTTWRGVSLTFVDTGGVEFDVATSLGAAVQQHIRNALQRAEGVLLVCDAQEGLVSADLMMLEELRRADKPIVLAVNKADHRLVVPPEFFTLGLEVPLAISALHGLGTGELLDRLLQPSVGAPEDFSALRPSRAPRRPTCALAIIGRQNVGKSSLLNTLLREERVIVHDRPGTTRDAIDTILDVDGEPVLLIDTAGLRHRRKVRDPVDLFSMSRTIEAIRRCDVALLVLDATQGVTRDDRRIAEKICDEGCGLALLLNKWDLIKRGDARAVEALAREAMPAASFAPVVAISAKTGFQVPRVLPEALGVVRTLRQGLPASECTALLEKAWAARPVPRFNGRPIRLTAARWLPGRPASLVLHTKPLGRLPTPYQRYLLKRVHAYVPLRGVPVKLAIQGPAPEKRRRR